MQGEAVSWKGRIIPSPKGEIEILEDLSPTDELLLKFPDGSLSWHPRRNVRELARNNGGFKCKSSLI